LAGTVLIKPFRISAKPTNISAEDPYFASQPLQHLGLQAQKMPFATKPRGALAQFCTNSYAFWAQQAAGTTRGHQPPAIPRA
jgi:hypothetical protein